MGYSVGTGFVVVFFLLVFWCVREWRSIEKDQGWWAEGTKIMNMVPEDAPLRTGRFRKD